MITRRVSGLRVQPQGSFPHLRTHHQFQLWIPTIAHAVPQSSLSVIVSPSGPTHVNLRVTNNLIRQGIALTSAHFIAHLDFHAQGCGGEQAQAGAHPVVDVRGLLGRLGIRATHPV